MTRISEVQKKRGIQFRLRGFIKAELLTEEQAEAIFRSSFRWLLCGFDAADPCILTNIQTPATRDDNTRAALNIPFNQSRPGLSNLPS